MPETGARESTGQFLKTLHFQSKVDSRSAQNARVLQNPQLLSNKQKSLTVVRKLKVHKHKHRVN